MLPITQQKRTRSVPHSVAAVAAAIAMVLALIWEQPDPSSMAEIEPAAPAAMVASAQAKAEEESDPAAAEAQQAAERKAAAARNRGLHLELMPLVLPRSFGR